MSKRLLNASVLAASLLLATAASAAGEVPDPTRPAISASVIIDDAESAPAPMVLQSTLISPQQRSAIIDGRRYRIGERVGDARLAAIEPGVVRLSGPMGNSELRLSYSISSRPVNH